MAHVFIQGFILGLIALAVWDQGRLIRQQNEWIDKQNKLIVELQKLLKAAK